jgi:murein DD-endopeptidase MepM/ murein hydrolase activator NlpD
MYPRALLLLGFLTFCQFAWGAGLKLDGPVVQGGLVLGQAAPGSRVIHDGMPVRVSPQGVFLIGFGRDAEPDSTLALMSPTGERLERKLNVRQRQYKIQRIDGLPPRKVTPRPEDLTRIRADAVAARAARDRDDPRTDFIEGFIWPSIGPISGVYGSQRILNGKPRRPHFGVDVAAPVGAPVVAPAAGIVTLAHPDMFYSGATLIIDHGHGLSSSFLHLNRILVKEGQKVTQGQPIAEVGASGRVTGAHLDWRMNLGGKRIDPQLLVGAMPAPDQAQAKN